MVVDGFAAALQTAFGKIPEDLTFWPTTAPALSTPESPVFA